MSCEISTVHRLERIRLDRSSLSANTLKDGKERQDSASAWVTTASVAGAGTKEQSREETRDALVSHVNKSGICPLPTD